MLHLRLTVLAVCIPSNIALGAISSRIESTSYALAYSNSSYVRTYTSRGIKEKVHLLHNTAEVHPLASRTRELWWPQYWPKADTHFHCRYYLLWHHNSRSWLSGLWAFLKIIFILSFSSPKLLVHFAMIVWEKYYLFYGATTLRQIVFA